MNKKEEHRLIFKRNIYNKRRNIIRRLFLLFSVFLYIFVFYKFYVVSYTTIPEIEIVNNHLVNSSYLKKEIANILKNKNIFFVSSRGISNSISKTVLLFKNVLIRKYIFPESKIIVFVNEKTIWADLRLQNRQNSKISYYVTSEGDFIPLEYLNLMPNDLVSIVFQTSDHRCQKSELIALKRFFDELKEETSIAVSMLLVNNKGELELYTNNDLKIMVGKIVENELISKVHKLKLALAAIKERSYSGEYLDLTLEDGAVFKKNNLKNQKVTLFTKSLFAN